MTSPKTAREGLEMAAKICKDFPTVVVPFMRDEIAKRILAVASSLPAEAMLTDVEIVAAWNAAVPDSKDKGIEMYLHLMRAIAKAQYDKCVPAEPAVVGGEWMEQTIATHVLRCEHLLAEEQSKVSPDNALIAVLCDSVRMAREYVRSVQTSPAEPAARSAKTGYCKGEHGYWRRSKWVCTDPTCPDHKPSSLPAALPEWTENEAMRLLAFREAHCKEQHDEAWHHIYWLVSDRAADQFNPWAEVEALASAPKPDEEGSR